MKANATLYADDKGVYRWNGGSRAEVSYEMFQRLGITPHRGLVTKIGSLKIRLIHVAISEDTMYYRAVWIVMKESVWAGVVCSFVNALYRFALWVDKTPEGRPFPRNSLAGILLRVV